MAGTSRARQVIDFAETDGLLKYDSGERAIAERRRDRLLPKAGFEVVHVTRQELFGDPARVAGRIQEACRRAERLGLAR
jgi:very-short-patch-repair endonuclease